MGLLWHDARLGAHSSRNQATQCLDPKQNAGHWGWSITPTFSLESPWSFPHEFNGTGKSLLKLVLAREFFQCHSEEFLVSN